MAENPSRSQCVNQHNPLLCLVTSYTTASKEPEHTPVFDLLTQIKNSKKRMRNREQCKIIRPCDLRQSDSSDLSMQSGCLSHFHAILTHSPLPQRNSPALHSNLGLAGSSVRPAPSPHSPSHSSDPSKQSGSLSQVQGCGIHSVVLQRNWSGPHDGGEHCSSSVPSPQSSSPSHTYAGDMHFRLRHWNSPEAQDRVSVRNGAQTSHRSVYSHKQLTVFISMR